MPPHLPSNLSGNLCSLAKAGVIHLFDHVNLRLFEKTESRLGEGGVHGSGVDKCVPTTACVYRVPRETSTLPKLAD